MKGFLIILAIACIGTVSSATYKECVNIELGRNIPYPNDCTKFITCIGGGVVKVCPDPLHFNAKLEVCDWPESAGCDVARVNNADLQEHMESNSQNSRVVDKIDPKICKGQKLGRNVPYPNDCTKFITCIGGGVVKVCPDPLHFNAKLEVCDWPESAGCDVARVNNADLQEHMESNSQNSKIVEKIDPKICKGHPLGKNIPYPNDCTKFITCIGGGKVQNCPDPLHFNAKLEVCDWPESAGCDVDRVNNADLQEHMESNSQNSRVVDKIDPKICKGQKLGRNVPYPNDCTKFITCIGGGKVQNCPDPLHFNAKLEVCDWPESAGCDVARVNNADLQEHMESNSQNSKIVEKIDPKICKGHPLGKNIPYPNDCTKFITCIGGGKVQNCPDPLHFNAKLEVCDWPESAGCDVDRVNNADLQEHMESNSQNSKIVEKIDPKICKGHPLGKNIPYPNDCTKFITCIGGGKVQNCPDPLHFNAKLEVCDWPESAGCDVDRVNNADLQEHMESNSQNSKIVEKIDPKICKGHPLGKNIPYPNDCTKFVTCIGGGVVKVCPDPLHFNAKLEVCDWPESANCPWW